MNLFYDESRNKVKNLIFQSKYGLVSYQTQNKELLPTVTKNEVIEVPRVTTLNIQLLKR